jgi:hypothetical protein
MSRGIALLAALALVPAMIGPAQARAGTALVIALCGGGTTTLPVNGGSDRDQGPQQGPCCAKGCHGGDRRKTAKAD